MTTRARGRTERIELLKKLINDSKNSKPPPEPPEPYKIKGYTDHLTELKQQYPNTSGLEFYAYINTTFERLTNGIEYNQLPEPLAHKLLQQAYSQAKSFAEVSKNKRNK